MEEVKSASKRLATVVVLFLSKLVLAAFIVAVDLGLKWLAGLALDNHSLSLTVVRFVLDVTFVGTATIIAVAGVIVVGIEVIRGTIEYYRQWH